ncbi:unnamed protein product [Polarella glacialis]|uniref:Uncharacterized protein n=1 Tax=Polarella glacialis TaxID=89957 RepID=A0A813M2D0_POLGL|nr:unnamed protein product [Polarella glacialis]
MGAVSSSALLALPADFASALADVIAEAASGDAILPRLLREEQAALLQAAAALAGAEGRSLRGKELGPGTIPEYDDKVRRCRQALGSRERLLGPEHPRTLTAVNNLVPVLSQRPPKDWRSKRGRAAVQTCTDRSRGSSRQPSS